VLRAAAAAAATAQGFGVALGRADELGQLCPLAALFSALPELGRSPPTDSPDLVHVQFWHLERVRLRLVERVTQRPLLVALDDLQWSDPTTLMALWTLRWQLASHPIVWVLARDTTVPHAAVARLYAALERDGVHRTELGPLDDESVIGLLTDVLGVAPGPALRELASGAAGNPLLLVALAEGLRDEGVLRIADGEAEPVGTVLPRLVREFADRRLDQLGGPARQFLETAAVLGRCFAPEDVAELLGEPLAAQLPVLEEVIAAEVLVSRGDVLAFRHDLLWRALVVALPPPVRLAMHRQVGEVLLRRGGSAVPAAEHLVAGGRDGHPRALLGLDRALGEVRASSPRAGADLAVRTLELTDPTDPEWLPRAQRAVDAMAETGRLADAATLAHAALARPLTPLCAGELRCSLAAIHHLGGHAGEAIVEIEEVLAQRPLPGALRDRAELVLLDVLADAPDDERAEELATTLLTSSAERPDDAVVAALVVRAVTCWDTGRLTEALRFAREAVDRTRGASREARGRHPRLALAGMLADLGCAEEAEVVLREAREEMDGLGHWGWTSGAAVLHARLELTAGRLDDAVAAAEMGLATADALGTHLFTALAVVTLGEVALRHGDLRAAAGYVDSDRARLSHYGPTHARARRELLAGRVCDARDGPEKAVETLAGLYAELPQYPSVLACDPTAAPWLVRVALAGGRPDRAELVADAAGRLAHGNPAFARVGAASAHASGLLHSDAGLLGAAVRTSLGGWARASAAEDLGVLVAAAGAHRDGVVSLEEALASYAADGALRDAARVRRRLRRMGVRHRHWSYADRPLSGWDSLTETEVAVSRLVAQGWTNRQIADQSFLSVHTVAYHLRRIFRKLDIASRVDLTRMSVEHRATDGAGGPSR
jgi:DNA-binding NarL/FixJ family response regulator